MLLVLGDAATLLEASEVYVEALKSVALGRGETDAVPEARKVGERRGEAVPLGVVLGELARVPVPVPSGEEDSWGLGEGVRRGERDMTAERERAALAELLRETVEDSVAAAGLGEPLLLLRRDREREGEVVALTAADMLAMEGLIMGLRESVGGALCDTLFRGLREDVEERLEEGVDFGGEGVPVGLPEGETVKTSLLVVGEAVEDAEERSTEPMLEGEGLRLPASAGRDADADAVPPRCASEGEALGLTLHGADAALLTERARVAFMEAEARPEGLRRALLDEDWEGLMLAVNEAEEVGEEETFAAVGVSERV